MDPTLLAVVAGLVGVPLVNIIKARLGWSGDRVKLLAGVVAGGLAVGALFATGQLLPLTLDNLAAKISVAFAAGQVLYTLLPRS